MADPGDVERSGAAPGIFTWDCNLARGSGERNSPSGVQGRNPGRWTVQKMKQFENISYKCSLQKRSKFEIVGLINILIRVG